MRYSYAILAVASILLAPLALAQDFQKGLTAYEWGDFETALAEWQPLADAGDARGQFWLAKMYSSGIGVEMNDDLAIKFYSLAAEQGHAEAQCNLAVMYQNGWGVPQSEEEALKLFKPSAEQGVTEAMIALGQHYENNYSGDYDPALAYKWYGLAEAMGDFNAGSKRDVLAEHMTVEQIAEGDGLIETWSTSNAELLANQ